MPTTWKGESGKRYIYRTFEMPHKPPEDTKGNYIFAEQLGNGTWFAIYVGQGDLRDRYNAALREGCVTEKGATHYHYHTNNQSSVVKRLREENDIIEGNPECESPLGCNGQDP